MVPMKKRTFLGFGIASAGLWGLPLKARSDAGFLQDLEKAGAQPFSQPSEEKFLHDEVARWTQVIKAIGFKIQ